MIPLNECGSEVGESRPFDNNGLRTENFEAPSVWPTAGSLDNSRQ